VTRTLRRHWEYGSVAWDRITCRKEETWISAYQCRAGTEKAIDYMYPGIHGMAGYGRSQYIGIQSRVQGAYFSTRKNFFSCLVPVVLRTIADKDFARPGRSCSFVFYRAVYISQTCHGTRVRWRGWEGNLKTGNDMRV
jgi:hypothetical protein